MEICVQETSSEEMQKRIKTSFMKMAALFPDPSKAEDSFHKLNQMKEAQNNTNQRTNISTLTNQTGAFKDNGALKTKMDSIWYVQLKA